MKRKKNAMTRAGIALLLSSSMTMNALASTVTTEGTVDVETTAAKSETVDVTITISTSSNADGGYSVTTTTKDNGDKTQNGSLVDYNGDSKMDTTENGVTTGTENTKYEVTNGDYHAEGGSETSIEANDEFIGKEDGIEVDVSLEDGGQNTASGSEMGTETEPTGKDTTKEDGNYDYTTETVVGQGSVTITTEEITFKETVETGSAEMEYVKSETTPTDTNDLTYVGQAPDAYLPGYEGEAVIPESVDGYEYVYVGSGNTSMLVPAIVFNTPMSDEDKVAQYGEDAYIKKNSITYYYVGCLTEEDRNNIKKDGAGNYVTDEDGFILDKEGNRILKEELTTTNPNGETLYLHRFDATGNGHKVEGWFEDGEWVKELNGNDKYTAVWAGPQQFVLVDTEGNIITAYCADFSTPTQDNFGYNIENLEDADYYSDAEAERIRSIAHNGYWGTKEGTGSLETMTAALLASGKFTEEELKSLTDGVALTATQMAIWSCSNKMTGIEFINAHYATWGTGDVPTEKEDEVKLLFKVYNYLTNLAPTEVTNTTKDTVINADNFVDDLSVTVVKKASDHDNNNDDDDTNDAYVTNISFALVVQPSTENGDDLIVQVIDAKGNVLAKGKVAGNPEDGIEMLEKDAEGNYAFTNIVMVEGEQNFRITMEGIQNLKEGVYLYTSEVDTGDNTDDTDDVSSQTLVGVAEGERAVNVSMNIKFDLDVKDEIVATEHVWRKEWVDRDDDNGGNGNNENTTIIEDPETPLSPTPLVMFEEAEVPLSDVAVLGAFEIEDDMIPLAVLPATGDNSLFLMFMSLLSGLSLAGASLVDKMKKRKR